MPIIQVHNLSKHFKSLKAVDDISFTVNEGEVFGFLGPNGAGKTTTINILCTLLSPTAGAASIAGYDCAKNPDEVRTAIGIIFQDTTLDTGLTAYENLKFHAYLYNLDRALTERRIDEMLDVVELQSRKHDLIKNFSGGMKRRLEIARGLLHYPRVLVPGRTDHRPGSADTEHHLGLHQHAQEKRKDHRVHDHALHGGGGELRPHRHHGPRQDHCHGHACPAQGNGAWRCDHARDLGQRTGRQEIQKTFGMEARVENGTLSLEAEKGDELIPRLIHGLSVTTLSVGLKKPTLNDVFLRLTGRTIRDEGPRDNKEVTREFVRSHRRAQR